MKQEEYNKLTEANEQNKYITEFAITEKNIEGKFIGGCYLYRYIGDSKPSTETFKDIIFQCCEIERIYDNELFVETLTTYNGGYVDSDEYIINVKISLTQNLSKYIKWEQCPLLPPIYQIDKEKSIIDIELN